MRSSGRLKTSSYSSRIGWEMNSLAGGVRANTRAVRSSPLGLRAAETTTLVSMTSLRGSTTAGHSRRLDGAINLALAEFVSAAADRRFAEALQDLGFRRGKPDVLLDPQENGPGTAPFFNDKTAALLIDVIENPAKLAAGSQGRNDGGWGSSWLPDG